MHQSIVIGWCIASLASSENNAKLPLTRLGKSVKVYPMNATSNVMRAEAKRLRSLAQRLEAFAAELDGPPPVQNGPDRTQEVLGPAFGEYHGMSQSAAILKALENGPQTTKELFDRLNAGGQKIKKRTYVTALLGRIKEKVERNAEGKVQLKSNPA